MAVITAADVCRHFTLSQGAEQLLKPDLLTRPFLELLIANQHYPEAAHLMAHALPRREAVWWACLCARLAYGSTPPGKEAAALQIAEEWVKRPSDENRRSAHKAGEAAEFKNPAGLIGLAIFFSSGSLAPPDVSEVLPAPHLCPNTLANAVILSTVLREPNKASEKYLQFFSIGLDVANGKNCWK